MRRREFLAISGAALALAPVATHAQQPPRGKRIGILRYEKEDERVIQPMLQGLEALGYVDGKTVAIEYGDADGRMEHLAEAASELARLNPDVIFSFGGEQAPVVKRTITTIPVVVVVSNDPVETGLVASLRRPGGNITGITYVHDALAGKSVELLKETLPSVSRVAILWHPDHVDPEFRATQRASRVLGLQLQSLEVRQPGDYDAAFQAATREGAQALIVIGSRLQFVNRHRIGEFAERKRLVLVGVPRWLIDFGALLNYGPNVAESHRRAAGYIDKILRGARPSDLPMQQPTTFELNVSLRAARRLGITVPPSIIARADRVID
jgi:ABC-type uncharacterized transport system substrate-binding protein